MIFFARATPFLIHRHIAKIVSAAIMIASFRSSAFINYWRIGYYFLVSSEPRNDVFFCELRNMDHHVCEHDNFPSVMQAS